MFQKNNGIKLRLNLPTFFKKLTQSETGSYSCTKTRKVGKYLSVKQSKVFRSTTSCFKETRAVMIPAHISGQYRSEERYMK